MASREDIIARFAAIIDAVALADSGISGRNLVRTDDLQLPSYAIYDGEEEAVENTIATGTAPNVIIATPEIVVTFMDDISQIGASANEKLQAVQKAVLQDAQLKTLCRGFRPAGARYIGCGLNITDEAKKATAELTVRFSIAYTFNPANF